MTVSVDTVSVTLGIEAKVAEKSASDFPANILAGSPISFFVKSLNLEYYGLRYVSIIK